MRTAAGVRGLSDEIDGLNENAVAALMAVERNVLAIAGMEHERDIHAVHIAAAHEFVLAAIVFDRALPTKRFAKSNLDALLRGHCHQANGAGKPVQRAGLLQRKRDSRHRGALSVMPAGMGAAIHGGEVIGSNERVELAENQHLWSRNAGINIGIKAGNIVGRNHGIARGFEHILKKFRAFPFAIACFRMRP